MFVPRAPEIDQPKDKRFDTLAKIIAECTGIHWAAMHLFEEVPDWDFAAVFYDAIEERPAPFWTGPRRVPRPGGVPVFADDHRPADESNERGYLEHALARRLAMDSSWVGDARGKVVKVVTQLMPHSPGMSDTGW